MTTHRALALAALAAGTLLACACQPCAKLVREEGTTLEGDPHFLTSTGEPFDLAAAPAATMNHWKGALDVEWIVRSQDDGEIVYHAALLLTHMREEALPLDQFAARICDCGGPMLPAEEGADFDLCLWRLADGSSYLMSPQCMLLTGVAQVRRFAQDCFGAKGEEDCATVADVTLAGEGELGRARFSGTLSVRREEVLVDAACASR